MTGFHIVLAATGVVLYIACVVACLYRYVQTKNKQFLLLLCLLLGGCLVGATVSLIMLQSLQGR